MKAEVGNRIIVEAEKLGQANRAGTIKAVLAADPPPHSPPRSLGASTTPRRAARSR